jgi:PAS domain S-box-containing protein
MTQRAASHATSPGGGGEAASALQDELEALRAALDAARRRAERERGLLRALMDQSTHGIITCDLEGRLSLNRAAERIWGAGPAVMGIAEWSRYRAFHPDGRPFAPGDWSMARALRTGETIDPEYVTIERFDGARAVILAGAAPVRDEAGAVTGAMGVFADVTALKEREGAALALERRAADRAARLQEVTAALAQVLTADAAAATIVEHGRIAVGAFDGSVWRVDEAARVLRPVHAAARSAEVFSAVGPVPLAVGVGRVPVVDVVRDGAPRWIGSRAELRAGYPGMAELESYRALPDFAVACLPLTVEGRTTGALVFSFDGPRAFDAGERSFLLVLAGQAAQALERARLFEAERRARAAAEAAEARSAFLSEAAHLLGSSLDYEATLASVARLAVPRIADWCAIDLAEDFWRGAPSAIVAHTDPARVERARELQRRLPVDRADRSWVPEVLRTGKAELYPELSDATLEAMADSPERLAAARELEIRSAMVVPMPARGRVLGAITFVSSRPGRHGPEDLEMATHLARRAGLAVDNARLYRAAQDAVRARDEVLAFVSHDLKNPLSAVLMSAALLQRDPAGNERQIRHVATIRRSAERMDRLIHDLLDVSSMEAGRFRVDPRPWPPGPILAEAAALAGPLAAQKGIELEVSPGPAAPPVLADRHRVLQVLSNLLGNALTFTPPGGRVSLVARVVPDGRSVAFSVSDTGPGIPAEDQPHVFDRYWKSRSSREGSGLGLAIARGIVEAHGGRLTLSSRPGEGTTFVFDLPAAPPAAAPAARGG